PLAVKRCIHPWQLHHSSAPGEPLQKDVKRTGLDLKTPAVVVELHQTRTLEERCAHGGNRRLPQRLPVSDRRLQQPVRFVAISVGQQTIRYWQRRIGCEPDEDLDEAELELVRLVASGGHEMQERGGA